MCARARNQRRRRLISVAVMPLRHVVLLKFHEETSATTVQAIGDALRGLPAVIPELQSYRVGPDLELADGTWDFVVSGDFASKADYEVYRDHPAHLQIIKDLIAPHVATRAAAQIAT